MLRTSISISLLLMLLTPTCAATEQPDPRIRAYREMLLRPAPEGVDPSAPLRWLTNAESHWSSGDRMTADRLRDSTEWWLASHSRYVWLADRVAYLCQAARLLRRGGQSAEALDSQLKSALGYLNSGNCFWAEWRLMRAAELLPMVDEEVAGGQGLSVLPDQQRLAATWLKSWLLTGYKKAPSPVSISWLGGPELKLLPEAVAPANQADDQLAEGFTHLRTWTGNTWRGPSFTLRASVLLPVAFASDIRDGLNLSLTGGEWRGFTVHSQSTGEMLNRGELEARVPFGSAVALGIGDARVVLIPDGVVSVRRDGDRVLLSSRDTLGVAIVRIPSAAPIGPEVVFWSRVAAEPPVECVQTVSGGRARLLYLFEPRKHHPSVKPLRVAPVPPLVRLAADSGWKTRLPRTITRTAAWRNRTYEYVEGSELSFAVPQVRRSGLRGANLGLKMSDEQSYKELAWRGATSVRLLVGLDEIGPPLAQHLEWCERYGLRANVDLHYQEISLKLIGTDEGRRQWAATWKRVAEICKNRPVALKCYDIGNEPMHEVSTEVWIKAAEACIAAIRGVDRRTPILVEAPGMGSPWALSSLLALKDPNLIYGVHCYTPHNFTYGRYYGKADFGDAQLAPYKFYPGWSPPVNWSRESESWFDGYFEWWDRHEIAASKLPVFEFRLRTRKLVDVGEFGVCGRNFTGWGEPSALMWLSDAIGVLESCSASWDVWSYNWGGFSWFGGGPDLLTRTWRGLNGGQARMPR